MDGAAEPPKTVMFGLPAHMLFLSLFTDSNPPPEVTYLVGRFERHSTDQYIVVKVGEVGFAFKEEDAQLLVDACEEFAKHHPEEDFSRYFQLLAKDMRECMQHLGQPTIH